MQPCKLFQALEPYGASFTSTCLFLAMLSMSIFIIAIHCLSVCGVGISLKETTDEPASVFHYCSMFNADFNVLDLLDAPIMAAACCYPTMLDVYSNVKNILVTPVLATAFLHQYSSMHEVTAVANGMIVAHVVATDFLLLYPSMCDADSDVYNMPVAPIVASVFPLCSSFMCDANFVANNTCLLHPSCPQSFLSFSLRCKKYVCCTCPDFNVLL
jgi:hypothetical protein